MYDPNEYNDWEYLVDPEEAMKQGTIHELFSPYPKTLSEDGKVIWDERCTCGALQSEHFDTTAYGHGAHPTNGCTKFTWSSFVFIGEPNVHT